MASLVLGVFSQRDHAEDAIDELQSRGYNPKDISIMMKDSSEAKRVAGDTGADVVGSTVGGAATGAVIGGIAGLVASFMIPGLGAFFIGGPIATALGLTGAAATTTSGAATGALAGGIIGALTSTFGLSNNEARVYEKRLNDGGILVAVPARMGDEQEVKMILSDLDADNIRVVETPRESRREEMREPEYGPAYLSEMRPRRTRTERSIRRSRERK